MPVQRVPRQPGLDPAKPVRYRRIPVPNVSTGGTPTPGNLRWGPNFGNNEQQTFAARAAISAAEYRQITQKDLIAQEAITLIGAISALLNLTVEEQLNIFFTLVFLYTTNTQESIRLVAIQEAGGVVEQTAIAIKALQTAYGLSALAALNIFFTLTFLYTTFVVASVNLTSLQIKGLHVVQGVITGAIALGYSTLTATVAARMVALTLAGKTQVNALPNITTAQVGSLQTIVQGIITGALSPVFTDMVAAAPRMVALQESGTLQEASIVTGKYTLGPQLAGTVQAAVKLGLLAVGSLQTNVAAAIRQPALAEVGLLRSSGAIKISALQEFGTLQARGQLGLTYVTTHEREDNSPGSHAFTVPSGVTSLLAEAWGGGGGGGTASVNGGGGGGGGGYARENAFTVAVGDVLTITHAGASANATAGTESKVVRVSTTIVRAAGGAAGGAGALGGHGAGGAGGAGTVGDVFFTGGAGGGPNGGVNLNGGGGGGGAGTANNGGVGGAAPGAGGTAGANGGGAGAAGANGTTDAGTPSPWGGGAGGNSTLAGSPGGARGACRLTMVAV